MTHHTVPFWCDEPCPAWCDEQHHASDHVADRQHIGATRTLTLATMPAVEVITPGDPEWRPVELLLELAQGYRECEPRICLASTGDAPGAWLTLAEAAELARQITDLVALARGHGGGR